MILILAFKFLLFHILVLSSCFRLYVFFRRYVIARIVDRGLLYSKDCFDWKVILFNFRIYVCKCPTGVNCL